MKIVKRKGHTESYDERKLYASVYAACRAVRLSEEKAEEVANEIETAITKWMEGQGEVSSEDLLNRTADILERFHGGAALLYRSHMDVS